MRVCIDIEVSGTYHRAPMSVALPEYVDVARMAAAGRSFEGSLPLARMPRLRASLASDVGAASYRFEFGRGAFGGASLSLEAEAGLPLTCQRTLETFVLPVRIDRHFGLIAVESEEAAMPPDHEAILMREGCVSLRDILEDELILSLPVVALAPGQALDYEAAPQDSEPEPHTSPFAVLGQLKKP
jgi:uncharacterized protein